MAGQPSPLPELPIQYADFACWQHDWLASGIIERQLAYWRRHLARPHPVLDSPTDHPRPPMRRFAGAMERLALSATLTAQLKALSGLERATLYMTLLTAFTALLARYTGQADLVVGSVTAGRNRAEVEPLLGYFLNLLPPRLDASGDPSFRTLLRRVRDVALEGLAHDDIPFERLVEALVPARDPARNPLFDVLFSLEPPLPALPEGWKLTQLDVETGGTKLDLYLELDARPEGAIGRFIYRTDLFEAATVRRMADHLVRLLEAVTADPDSPLSGLPLLTEDERRQILDRRRAVPGPAPAPVDGTRGYVAPGDALEARLRRIWEDLLGVRPIGVTDDFFDLGGHSLLALRLLDSIRKEFQRSLPTAALMRARTVRGLSAVIRHSTRSSTDVIATVQPGRPGAPIFAVPGVWGGILGFVELARALGTERPVYGLQRPVAGSSLFARIEVIAALFLREILSVRPRGPYHLMGACMGGVIAFEMAQQLLRQGKQVGLLAFIDTFPPGGVDPMTHLVYRLRLPLTLPWFVMRRARGHLGRLRRLASDFSAGSIAAEVRRVRGALDPGAVKEALTGNEMYDLRVYAANYLAFQRYVPQSFPGRIHLISAAKRDLQGHDDTRERWRHLARKGVETYPVVAHDSGGLMRAPAVYDVAETLRLWLGRIERGD